MPSGGQYVVTTHKENFFAAPRQVFSDHVPIAASITEDDEGSASTFRFASWNIMHTRRLSEQTVPESLKNSPIFLFNVKDPEHAHITKRERCNVNRIVRLLNITDILCLQEVDREVLSELRSQVDKKRFQIVATGTNYEHIEVSIFNKTLFEIIRDRSQHGFCDRAENFIQEVVVRNKKTLSTYQIFNAQVLSRPDQAREELVEWVSRQIDSKAKVILLAGSLYQPVQPVAKALKGIKHARFIPVPISYASTIDQDNHPEHLIIFSPLCQCESLIIK